jgi:hypothetical protein
VAKFSGKDQRLTAFSGDALIYISDSTAIGLLRYTRKNGYTMPRCNWNTTTSYNYSIIILLYTNAHHTRGDGVLSQIIWAKGELYFNTFQVVVYIRTEDQPTAYNRLLNPRLMDLN